MNKTTKLVLIIVSVAVIVWLFVASPFASENPELETSPDSRISSSEIVIPVKVSVAKKADLVKRLQTSGIIRAKREVDLITRIAGEIVSLSAFNGKYVEKGELLAKLDDREYQVAFEKARAALLSAQIEYKSLSSAEVTVIDSTQLNQQIAASKLKFEKAEEQFQHGKLSQEEYIGAKRDYDADMAYYGSKRGDLVANKSGLTVAQEMFERAKLNLEWTEIRAPFSGYVANCELNERMQVQAGKPLFKIVEVSSLLVDVDVLESEIGALQWVEKQR